MSQSNPYIIDKAEAIRVESDERGFELHIDTVDGPDIILNVQACAVDLYNEVVKTIGPWIGEMLAAKREYDTGIADDPAQQPALDRIKGVYDQESEETEVESFLEAAEYIGSIQWEDASDEERLKTLKELMNR